MLPANALGNGPEDDVARVAQEARDPSSLSPAAPALDPKVLSAHVPSPPPSPVLSQVHPAVPSPQHQRQCSLDPSLKVLDPSTAESHQDPDVRSAADLEEGVLSVLFPCLCLYPCSQDREGADLRAPSPPSADADARGPIHEDEDEEEAKPGTALVPGASAHDFASAEGVDVPRCVDAGGSGHVHVGVRGAVGDYESSSVRMGDGRVGMHDVLIQGPLDLSPQRQVYLAACPLGVPSPFLFLFLFPSAAKTQALRSDGRPLGLCGLLTRVHDQEEGQRHGNVRVHDHGHDRAPYPFLCLSAA
jgi:hypothetical protein